MSEGRKRVWVLRAKSFSWRVELGTAVRSTGSELNSHVPSAAFCASEPVTALRGCARTADLISNTANKRM